MRWAMAVMRQKEIPLQNDKWTFQMAEDAVDVTGFGKALPPMGRRWNAEVRFLPAQDEAGERMRRYFEDFVTETIDLSFLVGRNRVFNWIWCHCARFRRWRWMGRLLCVRIAGEASVQDIRRAGDFLDVDFKLWRWLNVPRWWCLKMKLQQKKTSVTGREGD